MTASPDPESPGLPGSPRLVETIRIGRTLAALLTILAGASVLGLISIVLAPAARVLVLLLLGAILAFILLPLVRGLTHLGLARGLALPLALLALLAALALATLTLLRPLTEQLTGLAIQLPAVIQAVQQLVQRFEDYLIGQGASPEWIVQQEIQIVARLNEITGAVLTSIFGILTGLIGSLLDFLLVLTFSAYLLGDGPRFRDNLVRLLPERWRGGAFFTQTAITTAIGGYIVGQLTVGLFVATMAGLGCWLLGVPFPLVIALLAGLFELIPVLGPYLSAVPALLIALPQGFPTILWVLLLFLVIQQVELNLLGPRITGRAVGLHPFVALIVILAGANYGGFIGVLAAVPVAAAIYLLAARAYFAWLARSALVRLPERLAHLDAQARQAQASFEQAEQARAIIGSAGDTG